MEARISRNGPILRGFFAVNHHLCAKVSRVADAHRSNIVGDVDKGRLINRDLNSQIRELRPGIRIIEGVGIVKDLGFESVRCCIISAVHPLEISFDKIIIKFLIYDF